MGRAGRGKGMLRFYASALLALAGMLFAAFVVVPFWRVRGVVKALAAKKDPIGKDLDAAIKSLGGGRRAADLTAGYVRWPDFLAADKKTAQRLLSACGDEALGPAAGLLRSSFAARRVIGAQALAGYEFWDQQNERSCRRGPDSQKAAQLLASALDDPSEPVRIETCRALERTGPPRLMPLDAFRECLTLIGWRVLQEQERPPYRVTECSTFSDSDGPCSRVIFSRDYHGKHLILTEWAAKGLDVIGLNFADLTGDDREEAYFNEDSRGTDWRCRPLHVFELGEEPREITPQTEGLPVDVEGANIVAQDGAFEDYLREIGLSEVDKLLYRRTYSWDARRGRFVDVTAKVVKDYESFGKELELKAAASFKEWACQAIDGLLGYWRAGKAKEGWRKFSAHVAKVKPKLSAQERKLIEKIEADLRRRLNIAAP